jgi:hypothetical protein
MTEQQQHLSQVLNQQEILATEIQELNTTLNMKREQFLKLQGIVEYLIGNGVTPETTNTTQEELKK